jgi:hypothetical protein
VTTAIEEDGRVLACKRATGDEDGQRLRHEAAMLERAQHPGVVELVGCRDVDGVTTLYTGFVGAHTLETARLLPLERAGATVAMLAATLADLHQLELVHGRVDPSHVLLGPGGRPVLCGFTGAGTTGEVPLSGPGAIAEFRDPAATDGTALSPTADVFALGAMLRVLVIGEGAELEPIPDNRFALPRGRKWNGYLRRALLTLADQATDEQPLRRPSARRFAADLEAVLPRADKAPRRAAGAWEPVQSTDGPTAVISRGRVLAPVAIALVLAFWAVSAWRRTDTTAAPAAPASVTPVSSESTTTTTSPPASTQVSLLSARVASVAGQLFSIGDAGDRVVLGDWNCDGVLTAAIARPSTGEVFVFDSWPSGEGDTAADPVANVSDAVDVRAEARGNCSALFAIRANGSEVEVV